MYFERNEGPLAKKKNINWLVVRDKNLKENLAISIIFKRK